MRKINFKNIALVIGVSVFDIALGAYDRIVNNTGFLKGASDWYASVTSQAVALPASTVWNTSTVSLATTTQSSFALGSIVAIVMVAVAVLGVLFMMVGSRAA
jgi:hypothetical protein